MRTDTEHAVTAIAGKVKEALPDRVVVEVTPKHSSASNPEERYVRSVESQTRSLRAATESSYKGKITANSTLFPWIPRHAAWLVARYQPKANGYTAYHDAYGHDYKGDILPFGEVCLYRVPKPSHRLLAGNKRWNRGDSVMKKGVWVGKSEEDNGHLLITPHGLERARTVRRLEPNKRFELGFMSSCKGTPWNTQQERKPKEVRALPPVAVAIGDAAVQPAINASDGGGGANAGSASAGAPQAAASTAAAAPSSGAAAALAASAPASRAAGAASGSGQWRSLGRSDGIREWSSTERWGRCR